MLNVSLRKVVHLVVHPQAGHIRATVLPLGISGTFNVFAVLSARCILCVLRRFWDSIQPWQELFSRYASRLHR